jgi:hypothetical protein
MTGPESTDGPIEQSLADRRIDLENDVVHLLDQAGFVESAPARIRLAEQIVDLAIQNIESIQALKEGVNNG